MFNKERVYYTDTFWMDISIPYNYVTLSLAYILVISEEDKVYP